MFYRIRQYSFQQTLKTRVPGWRRAPQGLGRGPLGPAAASLARERCQIEVRFRYILNLVRGLFKKLKS